MKKIKRVGLCMWLFRSKIKLFFLGFLLGLSPTLLVLLNLDYVVALVFSLIFGIIVGLLALLVRWICLKSKMVGVISFFVLLILYGYMLMVFFTLSYRGFY